MKSSTIFIAALAVLSISAVAAPAQTKSGVDKLYILNCGESPATFLAGHRASMSASRWISSITVT
jgi:hypothetical protein